MQRLWVRLKRLSLFFSPVTEGESGFVGKLYIARAFIGRSVHFRASCERESVWIYETKSCNCHLNFKARYSNELSSYITPFIYQRNPTGGLVLSLSCSLEGTVVFRDDFDLTVHLNSVGTALDRKSAAHTGTDLFIGMNGVYCILSVVFSVHLGGHS